MRLVSLSILLVSLLTASPAQVPAPALRGVWKPVTYHIQGKDHPMEGLFIFTERHFSANVRYKQTSTALDDSNANAGTYRTDGDKLTFTSDLAAHIRPGKQEEPIHYNRGGVEAATYRVEGNRLIITFPSSNRYEAERVQ